MKKIGIIGAGEVGRSLATGFMMDSYDVMVGSRDGSHAAQLDVVMGKDVAAGTFREVAAWGELIILAVKGSAAEGVASDLAAELAGKTIIDVTNPISDADAEDGVLRYFTTLDEALGERIQAAAPEARVVKAWNTVSHRHMIAPDFASIPTMPICGNDEGARKEVAEILTSFGWHVEDMGGMKSARAIEPLTMLLCIPGFQRGEWGIAFKMLRRD